MLTESLLTEIKITYILEYPKKYWMENSMEEDQWEDHD
jgi:hypothetical protein